MWRESAALALSTAGVLTYAVRGRSSSVFAPSRYHGDRNRRSLALTFDDGPSESTARLLQLLDRHNARATFFQCGANVRRLPGTACEVAQAGHEIGNHTETHPALCFQSSRFMRNELRRAQESIETVTGSRPSWFRAPFGIRWPGLAAAQRDCGLTGVMWTTIGLDWKLPAAALLARLRRGIGNGAILCLHDGRELQAKPDLTAMLQAVGALLPEVLDRGYRLETLSELLCPKN